MMINHIKGSTEVKSDQSGWLAFIRGSENAVKRDQKSSFGGMMLPVGRLELVEVWGRSDMRLQPS